MDSEEHSEEHDEPKPTALGRLREHFVQELDPSWTDVVLLFSCFIAGVLDSAVLNTYTCFVSMQTGEDTSSGTAQCFLTVLGRKHGLRRARICRAAGIFT